MARCNKQEYGAHPKIDMTLKDYLIYLKTSQSSPKDCLYLKDFHFKRFDHLFTSFKFKKWIMLSIVCLLCEMSLIRNVSYTKCLLYEMSLICNEMLLDFYYTTAWGGIWNEGINKQSFGGASTNACLFLTRKSLFVSQSLVLIK